MKQASVLPNYVSIAAVGVLLALVPLFLSGSNYLLRIAIVMLVFMAYVVAFNIIFGHTNQLFLCIGAITGSATYVSVVLTRELEWAWWLTLPLGVLVAAAIGAMFSYVSVRRGLGTIFLGIVTLAFALVFENLILGLRTLTGGETGIVTRGMGPAVLQNLRSSYYVFLGLLLVALLLYHFLLTSRLGLAFSALSDDELSAELSGIDVTRYKVIAAAIGSGLVGMMGAFYGYYNGFINPDVYSFAHIDVVIMVMLIFGGRGTLLGPIIGGAAFAVVNEIVRPLGPLTLLVYGALFVALFLVFRQGFVSAVRRVLKVPLP